VYRVLLKPRWILSHLFVLACVVGMVCAGLWQVRRLEERRDANAEIRAAGELPTAPIDEVLPSGVQTTPEEVDAAQWRSVTVTGTYAEDDQVLVSNRTYEGAPGFWVITPLVQADGTALAVNRGWVPYDVQPEGPWDRFAPPTAAVTVTGQVRVPQVRSSGLVEGPSDATDEDLRVLARVDVGRLQQQVDAGLYPLYLDLRTQSPAQPDAVPVPVPEPELGEGPHLGYAGQWVIFTLLTLIVYPLLLRRVARNRARDERSEADAVADGPDDDLGPPHGPTDPDPDSGFDPDGDHTPLRPDVTVAR
jgi:cytochrome oxidase assembly protein ShyY1